MRLPGPEVFEAYRLPGELGRETEYPRVHVRLWCQVAIDVRHERRVVEEDRVLVHHVVDVQAAGQPLPAEAHDLLEAQVELPVTPRIGRARLNEVRVEQRTGERTTDLLCDRRSRCIRRARWADR